MKDLKSSASITKGFLWVLGIIGSGLLSYWLYRTVRKLIEQHNMRRIYQEILQQREQNRAGNGEDETGDIENSCVVCLTNPREIVVLNCGHLCICAECMVDLPQPRKCPICRGAIVRHVSVYNP